VIPPKANSAFVAAMEDVLEVYTQPHDPERPLVCLDESSKQLTAETRIPVPMKPGRPARHDYEYERNGTANLFMLFAPLEGWRHVKVTDRPAADYAQVLKDLADSNSHFGLWSGFGAGSLTGQSQTKSLLGGSGAEAVGVCPSNSRAGPMIREFGRTNSHGALRHEETRHVGERPWPERPNLMEDAVAALRRPGSQADPARCRRLSNS